MKAGLEASVARAQLLTEEYRLKAIAKLETVIQQVSESGCVSE